ncbi:cytochrome P450 [Bradyrhizobium sp. CB1650]|uniref:cytochrome P450 n=1 Tax=Bradyrhizobium sp. CB1650 TaxID=3039153 RepID=UPI0024348EF8|nr:cytochrome P450 [Bradyrhizobium sp. CB1650]WGD51135.1 cytochrome P450 [Bradyrhizobium sp. CB1650]
MNAAAISPLSPDWSMLSLAEKDPFPVYDELRGRGDVVWDPGMKCWLILNYELCKAVESDEKLYAGWVSKDIPPLSYEIRGGKTSVTHLIGEEHARLRPLYLRVFSPAAMTQYRTEHVLPVVNDAIDRFERRGSADLVTDFSYAIPPRIMASMFGLPWKDDGLIDNIAECHRNVVAWAYNSSNEERIQQAKKASVELNGIFKPLVRERREGRGSDLISQLWTLAPLYWDNVGEDDIISLVRDMAIGAGETTTNAIANAVYLYLSDPALRQAVTDDREGALNAFVEETLRLFGAIQFRFRTATSDTSLAGVSIKTGEKVCMLHAAANRDPEHYACPHMADLERKRPTDHIAFNVGPRICPGMHLARLKMRESLKALIARLPNVRLDTAKEAPRFRGFSHRSFGPLHVVF